MRLSDVYFFLKGPTDVLRCMSVVMLHTNR